MAEREYTERHGPGRRREDRDVCVLHDLIQSDTKDHRAAVCSNIETLRNSMVPRWVFTLILSTVLVLASSGIGFVLHNMANNISTGQREIRDGLTVIHNRISKTDAIQTESIKLVGEKIDKVENAVIDLSARMKTVEMALDRGFEKGAKAPIK